MRTGLRGSGAKPGPRLDESPHTSPRSTDSTKTRIPSRSFSSWSKGRRLPTAIERGPLSEQEALRSPSQIGEALEAAHDRGIIHRDLKPANIKTSHLITAEGTVTEVLDFGLAKMLEADATTRFDELSDDDRDEAGNDSGIRAYMSPEQANGGMPPAPPTCGRSAVSSTRCSRDAARSRAPPRRVLARYRRPSPTGIDCRRNARRASGACCAAVSRSPKQRLRDIARRAPRDRRCPERTRRRGGVCAASQDVGTARLGVGRWRSSR